MLITLRLNFAYSRYWEGATSVCVVISKWLDVGILLVRLQCIILSIFQLIYMLCAHLRPSLFFDQGAFHYQSSQFDEIRPPTFGAISVPITEEHLDCFDRETPMSMSLRQERENESVAMPPISENSSSGRQSYRLFAKLRARRHTRATHAMSLPHKQLTKSINVVMTNKERLNREKMLSKIPIPMRFQDQLLNSNNDSKYANETEKIRNAKLLEMKSGHTGTASRNVSRTSRIPAPSLFLQETAHLLSLLSAVALSTLRNDIDIAASPLTPYIPGVPWPDVDPDNLPRETKKMYGDGNFFFRWLSFCLGLSRSAKRRTLYNAARPFGVLGGVSDSEIYALQRARGPYAKVSLVSMWLQEFITREYLAGSAGEVPAPHISRIQSLLSDGVAGYNQGKPKSYVVDVRRRNTYISHDVTMSSGPYLIKARKVAYVPFPFVSARKSWMY